VFSGVIFYVVTIKNIENLISTTHEQIETDIKAIESIASNCGLTDEELKKFQILQASYLLEKEKGIKDSVSQRRLLDISDEFFLLLSSIVDGIEGKRWNRRKEMKVRFGKINLVPSEPATKNVVGHARYIAG